MAPCPRPPLAGLAAAYLRATFRRPLLAAAAGLAVVAGIVGAAVPVGFRGLHEGAGITGGLGYGLLAATLLAPFLAPVIVTAVVAGDDDMGVSRELFLAGAGGPRRALAATAAGAVAALSVGCAAGLAGAVAGLADALREGTTAWTALSPASVGGFLAVTLWFSVVSGALAAALRRQLAAVGLLLGGAAVFFLGLIASRDAEIVRSLLSLTPYGPFWSLVYRGPSSYLLLEMSQLLRAAVLVIWPVGLAALAAARSRRPPD